MTDKLKEQLQDFKTIVRKYSPTVMTPEITMLGMMEMILSCKSMMMRSEGASEEDILRYCDGYRAGVIKTILNMKEESQ